MALNILTYNLNGVPWQRVPLHAIAEWIFKVSKAHVICLQEVFSRKHRAYLVKRAEDEGWKALYPHDISCLPYLECSSGLLTLVHPSLKIMSRPVYEPYKVNHGADRFVSKGYFKVHLSNGLHTFQLFNTHMQSDITNYSCYRLNYDCARSEQEKQLFLAVSEEEFPLVIGDVNMSEFEWFDMVDVEYHSTFPQTGEHLDHLLAVPGQIRKIEYAKTTYHDNVPWSDHIPVVYTVRFR